MNSNEDRIAHAGDRRRFLRIMGGSAAGLAVLAGCKDDVVGSGNVTPAPGPTPTPTPAPAPTYSASDGDRLNYLLQLHYVFAAYLRAGTYGDTLAAGLTSGTGTPGGVSGARQVAFTDQLLASQLREIATEAVAAIAWLRGQLGNAATAQPVINLAGGQGSPFQAISVRTSATPPTTFYDPYASEDNYLLGAVALCAVLSSAVADVPRLVAATLMPQIVGLAAAVGAHDGALRAALFVRALANPTAPAGQQTLFARANEQSEAREQYDGTRDYDQGIGSTGDANIVAADANATGLRRSAEQVFAILYATTVPASSGAFLPNGANGVIRYSGANFV